MLIGLTGGIGSGKSAAASMFADLGISTIDVDQAARQVVAPGQPALQSIAEHFGPQVLQADGSLDRKRLRELVFAAPQQRRWLEQLTHPLIRQLVNQQIDNASSAYVMLVSPLLVESGQHKRCDRILVVDVPPELQLARTRSRDGASSEQIQAIMQAQLSREQRLAHADDVINNSASLEHLQQQVQQLHQQYLALAETGK